QLAQLTSQSKVQLATVKADADKRVLHSQLEQQSALAKADAKNTTQLAQLTSQSKVQLATVKADANKRILHSQLEQQSALAKADANNTTQLAQLTSQSKVQLATVKADANKRILHSQLEQQSALAKADAKNTTQLAQLTSQSKVQLATVRADANKQIIRSQLEQQSALAKADAKSTMQLAQLESKSKVDLSVGQAAHQVMMAKKRAAMQLAVTAAEVKQRQAELEAESVNIQAEKIKSQSLSDLDIAKKNFQSKQHVILRQAERKVILEKERADREVARVKAEAEAALHLANIDAQKRIKQIESETVVRVAQHKSIQAAADRRRPVQRESKEAIIRREDRRKADLAVVKARAIAEIARVEASFAKIEAQTKQEIVNAQLKSDQAHGILMAQSMEQIAAISSRLQQREVELRTGHEGNQVEQQRSKKEILQEQSARSLAQAQVEAGLVRERELQQKLAEAHAQAKESELKLQSSLSRVEQAESKLTAALLRMDRLVRNEQIESAPTVDRPQLAAEKVEATVEFEKIAAKSNDFPIIPIDLSSIKLPGDSAVAVASTISIKSKTPASTVSQMVSGQARPAVIPTGIPTSKGQYSAKGFIALVIPMVILMLYLLYSRPGQEGPSGGTGPKGSGGSTPNRIVLPIKKRPVKLFSDGVSSITPKPATPALATQSKIATPFSTSLEELGISPQVGPVTSQAPASTPTHFVPRVVGNAALKMELAPLPPLPVAKGNSQESSIDKLTLALGTIREDHEDKSLKRTNSSNTLSAQLAQQISDQAFPQEPQKPTVVEPASPYLPLGGVLNNLRDSIDDISYQSSGTTELELPEPEPVVEVIDSVVVEQEVKESEQDQSEQKRKKWLKSERKNIKDFFSGREDLQGRLEVELEKRTLEDDWYYLQRIDLEEGEVELYILDETGAEKKIVADQITLSGVRSPVNVLELGTVVKIVIADGQKKFEVVRSDLYDGGDDSTVILLREFKDNFNSRGKWIEVFNQLKEMKEMA
ncbi:MAG: hypothetical protein HN353_01545, partial [Bdellovibrionales bacterium]|nr:hypothetical protein [Bdellovibrionales bacterium]